MIDEARCNLYAKARTLARANAKQPSYSRMLRACGNPKVFSLTPEEDDSEILGFETSNNGMKHKHDVIVPDTFQGEVVKPTASGKHRLVSHE